jgi:hypothetical protein
MKRILLVLGILYLIPGLFLATMTLANDLRSFTCEAPGEPHGVVGIYVESFENPNPGKCVRKGISMRSLLQLPVLVAFGTPIIAGKLFVSLVE